MKKYFVLLLILLLTATTACSQTGEAVKDALTEDAIEIQNTTNNNDDTDSSVPDDSSGDDNTGNTDATDSNASDNDATDAPNNGNSECSLTTVQQELLDAHNAARAVARDCGSTAYPAVSPLVWDCTLAKTADDHNVDMGTNNFFSHTGSNGLGVSDRATNAGYNWSTVGENIGAGYTTVAAAVQAWIDSPGHCENLMQASFKEMGGDVFYATGSDYTTYWTVNFGTESSF